MGAGSFICTCHKEIREKGKWRKFMELSCVKVPLSHCMPLNTEQKVLKMGEKLLDFRGSLLVILLIYFVNFNRTWFHISRRFCSSKGRSIFYSLIFCVQCHVYVAIHKWVTPHLTEWSCHNLAGVQPQGTGWCIRMPKDSSVQTYKQQSRCPLVRSGKGAEPKAALAVLSSVRSRDVFSFTEKAGRGVGLFRKP